MSSRYFWYCDACGAQNSREDGECQYCECLGQGCQRGICSGPCVQENEEGCDELAR